MSVRDALHSTSPSWRRLMAMQDARAAEEKYAKWRQDYLDKYAVHHKPWAWAEAFLQFFRAGLPK